MSLNFFTVDNAYVKYLQDVETAKRGFSRVPDMSYSKNRKPKFLCGIVLKIGTYDYYVPVSSYKKQMPDNFLIKAKNGKVISSLRFNYMFPVPSAYISVRRIDIEPDKAYKALLSQELRFCIKHKNEILWRATRTYKRVLLGKNPGLVYNSCDFSLLEEHARYYPNKNKEHTEERER